MKNNILLLSLILIFTAIKSIAQPFEMDELNIPNSPAIVLFDESPANIEKPTNPKSLAISLLTVSNGGGAIEFSPYWLKNHPNYTINDEITNHSPFLQTLAFSFASLKKNDISNVSAGFRVQLFRKYADENEILKMKDDLVAELSNFPLNNSKIQTLRDAFNEKRKKLKWNLELAGAFSGIGSKTTNLTANKLGAWMNIRHTPIGFPIDFVALARFSKTFGNTNILQMESSFIDFGGSISKQGDNFDLQIEYLYRRNTDLNLNYDRFAFVANYKINKDFVAVASLGKNFDKVDNIFTALGIKFSIAKQKMKL